MSCFCCFCLLPLFFFFIFFIFNSYAATLSAFFSCVAASLSLTTLLLGTTALDATASNEHLQPLKNPCLFCLRFSDEFKFAVVVLVSALFLSRSLIVLLATVPVLVVVKLALLLLLTLLLRLTLILLLLTRALLLRSTWSGARTNPNRKKSQIDDDLWLRRLPTFSRRAPFEI